MARRTALLALVAALALAATPAHGVRFDGRVLAESLAQSPSPPPTAKDIAPKAPAATASPSAAPMASFTIKADDAVFDGKTLKLKDVGDAIVVHSPDGSISLTKSSASFGPGSSAAPSDAVFVGITEEGAPIHAVLRLSSPMWHDGDLTFDAVAIPAADAKLSPGGDAARAAASGEAMTTAPFNADIAVLVLDTVPTTGQAGDKHGWIGAGIGYAVGDMVCGWACGIGGAYIGYG